MQDRRGRAGDHRAYASQWDRFRAPSGGRCLDRLVHDSPYDRRTGIRTDRTRPSDRDQDQSASAPLTARWHHLFCVFPIRPSDRDQGSASDRDQRPDRDQRSDRGRGDRRGGGSTFHRCNASRRRAKNRIAQARGRLAAAGSFRKRGKAGCAHVPSTGTWSKWVGRSWNDLP
jgi:hypothetical protein